MSRLRTFLFSYKSPILSRKHLVMPKSCNCKTTSETNSETNSKPHSKTNNKVTPMEPTNVSLNGWNFSRYECQIAMAIKLYIRNSNNETPSDETVGVIINSLRGQVNGVSLPRDALH